MEIFTLDILSTYDGKQKYFTLLREVVYTMQMDILTLANYLSCYLPFEVPIESFAEYLSMSRKELDKEPPIDFTDPVPVEISEDEIEIKETCPNSWFVSYWNIQRELERHPDYLLQGRYALGWFLCLLHYYNPKSF